MQAAQRALRLDPRAGSRDRGQPSMALTTPNARELRLDSRPTPMFPMLAGVALAGLVLTGLGVAAFVRVDQVVSVPGSLKPLRSTQDIKTSEPGVITAVLVKEGEQVQDGAPLITLDPTVLKGREAALSDQGVALRSSTEAEIERLQGALAELDSLSAGLRNQIAITSEQLQRVADLERQGAASRFQLLDYQKQLAGLQAQLGQNRDQRIKLQAESRQKRSELSSQQAELRANRVETGQRLQQVVLRAPFAGTVLNQSGKPRQVVGGGEVLLQLVPHDSLRAEAMVSNKDLAFVRPGQTAEINVLAYDRTKYGTVPATVKTIATDALPPDETNKEPHFPVSLRLNKQTLTSDGKTFPLQAGMAIAAELKLEKRSVLELFFSSFLRSTDAVRTLR
ncbi:MAG: HlyD family efflux transporter periplasmic adaptor subunit [Cyanobacteriota bacterium]